MAIDINTITDENVVIPDNAEAAPAEDNDTSGIPEAVLQMPIFQGLLTGAPAAVYTPSGTKTPETETVVKYGKELNQAGFGFFRDSKNKLDVFYNTSFLSPEFIKTAAEKGKIPEVASPLSEVNSAVSAAIGAPAGGSAPMGGDMSLNLPNTPVNTARINNLQPGSPTSGPSPGAGRVLNNLTKPVI